MTSTASSALEQFVARIDAFLAKTGMSQSAFGRAACNDGSFVADLRAAGRSPQLSTIERVEKFMRDYEAGADLRQAG